MPLRKLAFVTILVIAASLLTGSASASASGASLVRDIRLGSEGSYPGVFTGEDTNVAGTLFFGANDGSHGEELWRSDGTAAGTKLVRDIMPGSNDSGPYNLTNVGGTLFFGANDPTHGAELWRSDGTAAGTKLVRDINPASAGFRDSNPSSLTNLGGTLFFVADDGVHGPALWRSDGTAAGTKLVTDIHPSSEHITYVDRLTNVAGTLFFRANDGTHGAELWRSDGTAAGTKLVRDIAPGSEGPYPYSSEPGQLTNVAGNLFFVAYTPDLGSELWRSDGTAAGTKLVRDIAHPYGSDPRQLTNVSGTVFFFADDGVRGHELWRSDGTAAGTRLVRDIGPGRGPFQPRPLTNVAGTLFFGANDGSHGEELWRSDGTAAGTKLVRDITPGDGGSGPRALTSVGRTLFLTANDDTHGFEPWRSDGTAAGTELVCDILPGDGGSDPYGLYGFGPAWFAAVGGSVFFDADDGVHGRELWTTTAAACDDGGGGGGDGGGDDANEFSFGKVKKNKRRGTAKLTVNVPGAGELDLAKTKKVKADDESAEDAGKEKLAIKPKGKAKKKLNDKGKAKVTAEVTFTPDGGTPNTEDKKIKLVKR